MAKETHISWADSTINFWHGCQKVSEGCKFCYMYRDKARYGQLGNVVIKSSKPKFREALKWKEPKMIFTCSWSDFFIKEADEIKDEQGNVVNHWRKDAWEIIKATPHHTWLILTKRPERIKNCLPPDWGNGYPNVWLGVSIENQKKANYRIVELLKIKCAKRFLSAEPLLGPVNISPFLSILNTQTQTVVNPIDWVIVGGESGNETGDYKYRACRAEWVHDIVKQCDHVKVPVLVKQLGTAVAKQLSLNSRHGDDLTDPAFPVYLKREEFPGSKKPEPFKQHPTTTPVEFTP